MRITARGLSPVFLVTNAIVWVSAAIIMGILSYWISQEEQPDSIIYMEVVSVLTVAFALAALFLGTYPSYLQLFNLIFSYLWIVVVALATSLFTNAESEQAHAVQAFSFVAFFALLFNVLYSWYPDFGREQ
ncbi:hypothetical protein SAPIO_CDS6495 [Scedosporium apiospermum]|uniref:MARVEL domain-containing protein n=1 Tax=Pseudallescheria apiosperma TaxID=563466 RepID=A0A084G3M3_PSEDA|nr:uncharacterized protein SAPIO_CDS6495 [Scedosporium apiospermum]KEZ41935.1 hypothetical protein SAPIO_CDS6495 [Scedosporium apiospermum]